MKKLFTFVMMSLLLCGIAIAADEKKEAPVCAPNLISVGTGLSTGTYSLVFNSIKNLAEDLVCEYTKTGGGYDNVLLLLDRKIDAGLVPADVFDFLNRNDPNVREKLRSLFSLHGNALHIFVLNDGTKVQTITKSWGIDKKSEEKVVIVNLRDLQNRKVAAFASAFITAQNINERLKLNMEIVETKKDEGLAMLKNNQVFAFFASGGKPIEWIDTSMNSPEEKKEGKTITLAKTNPDDIQAMGNPYYATKLNYKQLNAIGYPSITVRNDLVVWNYTGKKAPMLLDLKERVHQNLTDIKEDASSHPVWQEVDEESFAKVFWQPYAPVIKKAVAKADASDDGVIQKEQASKKK